MRIICFSTFMPFGLEHFLLCSLSWFCCSILSFNLSASLSLSLYFSITVYFSGLMFFHLVSFGLCSFNLLFVVVWIHHENGYKSVRHLMIMDPSRHRQTHKHIHLTLEYKQTIIWEGKKQREPLESEWAEISIKISICLLRLSAISHRQLDRFAFNHKFDKCKSSYLV